jgi:hypothetical protein
MTLPNFAADIDATGEVVRTWLAANVPSLEQVLAVATHAHGTITSFEFEVTVAKETEAARVVAVGLVEERLGLRPADFSAWFNAMDSGAPLGPREANVRGYLRTLAGTPTEPKTEIHLFGLVGEFMLRGLLNQVDRGLGLPEVVEGHDWSATEHGADALAIYRHGGQLHFRLWESKAVTGATVYPTTVVGKAKDQLDRDAWEYLARYVTVARREDRHAEINSFLVEMPDLWRDGDDRAGAGIAIATHATKPTTSCFSGLAGSLGLPDANKQGHLMVAGDYEGFSREVRRLVWKGAGWTAP